MIPLTEKTVRASFVNASRKEATDLTLPPGFADLDWADLEYLGWRDPKLARRAYVVVPTLDADGRPGPAVAGVVLRQAEASPRQRAQCTWCQDVRLPADVLFYAAKRAGAAGRNGDTVGTLVCGGFECSDNVHVLPPEAYLGFDVEAARLERIASLRVRAAGFVENVRRAS
ncbi:FBP domain-containing protein [Frigoribacterium sp. RIT-PI-h]|uniref:FBP domain-containing protein n=1 Tax=Frigoribacterium sp. RIT-PI-h TaxID=1690245 RepID=UPI0006B87FB8|nr:FBP domain-containing protein [Frigoribacterium sp. RIT-PI-h]KPG83533.1 translation elongation factor [Frigoribacterium sp. RIT-PI-h]